LVKDVSQVVFRPTLLETDDDDLLYMIRRCWAEDPSDRPDFSAIKGMIKRINKYVFLKYTLSNAKQFCFQCEAFDWELLLTARISL